MGCDIRDKRDVVAFTKGGIYVTAWDILGVLVWETAWIFGL
jgi:hypothetical protein